MRIHHLDCGTLRPLGGRLVDGASPGATGRLVCHCLLIETDQHGLVLVDTGLGLRDVRRPWARLPWTNTALLRPRLDPERTALRHVEHLGFKASDVRHIVMTHLDFDHAGGLTDFPEAVVHLTAAELEAAQRREGVVGRMRWRPVQWGDMRHWRTYETRLGNCGGDRETWFGLRNVCELEGLPPDILLVPLPGHTPGHAGVAVQGPRGWMLHAGDSYFSRDEVHRADLPSCPPGLYAYERFMASDEQERQESQALVRQLAQDPSSPVIVFCTHDAVEFAALAVWSEGQAGVVQEVAPAQEQPA